jgi:tRNA A-37 threonylcarbamoyl transferase component Bud32
VTQQTHNHYRWQMADDFAPLLEELLRTKPVEVVKDDRAKYVARYELNGRAFYVKRYRHGAFPLRPLKFFFKRSQAAQEWWLAGELEKRGVPAVRHVALGERWAARGLTESVLITEAFDGVPAEQRHQKFFPQIIGLVESMAKARVTHADFHPANLLIHEATGEIRLIDLYGAHIAADESTERIRKTLLAQLGVSLSLPVDDETAHLARALRKQKLAERARRCLKNNRDFTRRRLGNFSWQLRRAALTPEVEAALLDPDAFITRAHVLKAGRSSSVGAMNGVVLKRHNFKKPLNLLKDLVRGSRGRRDFLKGYHLELCGIATARVIATADHRVLRFPIRSFALMEEIPSARNAGQAGTTELVGMARLIARLHIEGFTHRDLKETNILFNPEGAPHLIDLDGLSFVDVVAAPEAAGNLRRLAQGLAMAGKLTRSNVIACLLTYCRARQIFPRELFPRSQSKT